MLVPHQPDEDGREQREDIGLQKRDQQLEKHHEQRETDGSADHDGADHRRRGPEYEDQAEQHENHEVAGRHVGEQPQRQRERLDEFPDQLDGGHDDRHDDRTDALHPRRHHYDRLEVAFRAERTETGDLDREERREREPGGDGDIAGRGRAPRQEAEQVAVQNKEEERQDVGREDFATVADAGDRDVVADEQHQAFDRGSKAARRASLAVATLHLPAAVPDCEEDEECREDHEDDVLGGRDVDRGAGDEPGTGQVPLAQTERQLDELAVAGVLEDHRADVRLLENHLRNLVSRNKSGNSTPRYPRPAGSGGIEARWVTDHTRSTPSARNRIPMPPSQRAMNSGLGARIFGRSNVTAHSCASTATPPPIIAGLPPSAPATTTRTTPTATRIPIAFTSLPYRPLPSVYLPSLTVDVFLHAVVDAHETREPAHERTDDREQRPRMNPPIQKPPPGAEQEDGDREVERHAEVLVARAFVFLCGSHVAPGNLGACEIFRKQIASHATLCGV